MASRHFQPGDSPSRDFSVITNLRIELFQALVRMVLCSLQSGIRLCNVGVKSVRLKLNLMAWSSHDVKTNKTVKKVSVRTSRIVACLRRYLNNQRLGLLK